MKNLLRILAHLFIAITGCSLAAPVHLVDESPVSIKRIDADVILVDFGRVAFGNIQLMPPANANRKLTVHFGEDSQGGRINRKPPGTVRYAAKEVNLTGTKPVHVAPDADERNTQANFPNTPPAVLTPPELGVRPAIPLDRDRGLVRRASLGRHPPEIRLSENLG